MKNIRLKLDLFNETEKSAAELLEEETDLTPDSSVEADGEGQAPYEDENVFWEIARLLGCDAESGEDILKVLKIRRARNDLEQRLKRNSANKAYSKLISEADRLSSRIKGFDLKRELSDKRFCALIHSGFSLEEAWQAVHLKELLRVTFDNARKEAFKEILERIKEGGIRPEENGALGGAPAKSDPGVEGLTGKGIRDILRRVENGAKIKF